MARPKVKVEWWLTAPEPKAIMDKWKIKVQNQMAEALIDLCYYIAERMMETKHGIEYTKYKVKNEFTGYTHDKLTWIASDPSEFPAVRTGALVEFLTDKDYLQKNCVVEWQGYTCSGKIVFGDDAKSRAISAYAIDILEGKNGDGVRPWQREGAKERLWVTKEIMGHRLAVELQEGLLEVKWKRKDKIYEE